VWKSGGIAPPFLTLALDGDEWSASRLGRFTPGKNPGYPLNRRLNGPQSRCGYCGLEEKSLAPAGNRTPGVLSVALLYTEWVILAHAIHNYPLKTEWLLYLPMALTITNFGICPHSAFMCFVWFGEYAAIIFLNNINRLCLCNEDAVCLMWGRNCIFIHYLAVDN
jgi:hypothetical protein